MQAILQHLPHAPAYPPAHASVTGDGPVELACLARQAVAALSAIEPSRRIDVTLHDAHERLPVERMRIADALGCVLSNACRYSAADTRVRLSSRLECAHDGDTYIVITIADRGIGMTPRQQQRAFDVFYRADPSGGSRGAGLGLGLGIARDLVEAQGGWIMLHSAPGIGTEVELWLPRAGPAALDRAA